MNRRNFLTATTGGILSTLTIGASSVIPEYAHKQVSYDGANSHVAEFNRTKLIGINDYGDIKITTVEISESEYSKYKTVLPTEVAFFKTTFEWN